MALKEKPNNKREKLSFNFKSPYYNFCCSPYFEKFFKNVETEQQAFDFCKKVSRILPIDKHFAGYVLKDKGLIYYRGPRSIFDTANYIVDITSWGYISMQQINSTVARRALWAVSDANLSLGDKLLIRDIAIEGARRTLELALDPASCEEYNIHDCLRVFMNEFVLDQLGAYGFKVKDKHGMRSIKVQRSLLY